MLSEKEKSKRMLLRILSRIKRAVSDDKLLSHEDVFGDEKFARLREMVGGGENLGLLINQTRIFLSSCHCNGNKNEVEKITNDLISNTGMVNKLIHQKRLLGKK